MTVGVVLMLVLLVSAAPPRHGKCMTDLISPHGSVVRELCIFAPGGIVDMIMAIHGERTTTNNNNDIGIGIATTTPAQYYEMWFNAPAASLLPPAAGIFGQWQLAQGASANYNVSSNCEIALVNSAFSTPQNRTWTAVPDSGALMNVFADQGVSMLGVVAPPAQSVYCSFIPLFGSECEAARLLSAMKPCFQPFH
jgi:hypothetical protein